MLFLGFLYQLNRLSLTVINRPVKVVNLRIYVSDRYFYLLIFVIQNVNFCAYQTLSFFVIVLTDLQLCFQFFKTSLQLLIIINIHAFLSGLWYQLVKFVVHIWKFSFQILLWICQFLDSFIPFFFILFGLN